MLLQLTRLRFSAIRFNPALHFFMPSTHGIAATLSHRVAKVTGKGFGVTKRNLLNSPKHVRKKHEETGTQCTDVA